MNEIFMLLVGSVPDPVFADSAVAEVVARFGKINGLGNNAGVVRRASIEKMALEQWRTVIDVT